MVIISVKLLVLPTPTARGEKIFLVIHDEVIPLSASHYHILYIKHPVLSKILVLVYFLHFFKAEPLHKENGSKCGNRKTCHKRKKEKVILLLTESDESLHRHTCTHFQAPVSELEREKPRSGPLLSQS